MSIKQQLNNNLKNLIGKSVKQKYVIIESDDWGSIRMPSLGALERLKAKGLSLDSGYSKRYSRTDTLASKQDLEALFETLSKHKDVEGNSPVFTAFSLVANPDFDKIKANEFTQYEYEPFTTTLERYGQSDAFSLWKEGVQANLFYPEFHGREHLNVPVWIMKEPKSMRLMDKSLDTLDLKAVEEGQNFAYSGNDLNYERFEKSKKIVEDIIKLSSKNDSKIYLVIPPALFGKWRGHEDTEQFALNMKQKYSNVVFFDGSETILKPKYYYDNHHLNTQGVVYFTKIYLRQLEFKR